MMGITGAFSSLGINERPAPCPENPPRELPKNYSTMSLPNLVSPEKLTISPNLLRNNYSDYVCYDEIDSSDQPIDFSRKYCETKLAASDGKTRNSQVCAFNKPVKSYNSFTIYAETDLDQPTDYSLRYAEDDSDSDECKPKTETVDFVQDTVKTYCTEDTPYETPFNFSTSTSMSDLRIDDKTLDNKAAPQDVTVAKEAHKSEYSSGLMSPEKPVNYCDEGTPGYFSRVPSCGSLNCDAPKRDPKDSTEGEKVKRRGNESKAVKFEDVVNYAEETPLMFSRSSSLASLDSIEQHSIHDDRSSIVSDFSRLTSGLISPSELPDSPSQTVPPSPKPHKSPSVFSSNKKLEELMQPDDNVTKSSVFEDVVKIFKMDSTPLQFSSATSLSSLLGDDEVDSKTAPGKDDSEDLNNELSESSEDEDILAACINIGMQNNRYSQPKPNTPPPNEPFKFSQPKSDPACDSLRTYCTEDTPAILSQAGSNSDLSLLSMQDNEHEVSKNLPVSKANGKTDRNSQATTDNGSLLGKISDEQRDDVNASLQIETSETARSNRSSFSFLSDDSHESEEGLLQECILAGMPRVNLAPEKPIDKSVSQVAFDDENILADCINIGMKNNRYTQRKREKESPRSYYSEGTSVNHIESNSDMTVLLVKSEENGDDTDDFSYLNGSFSDEEDDGLLGECVRFGMAKIAEAAKLKRDPRPDERLEDTTNYLGESPSRSREEKATLNTSLEDNFSETSPSASSLSDGESEQAMLQECIRAGMPKPFRPLDTSGDLTSAEEALLQQCILEGMKKCQIAPKRTQEEDSAELTEAEQALLRQCILAGMPKNKNLVLGGPSCSKDSTELTESERSLLQQCILAGMPKNRKEVNRQWWRKPKEEKPKPEHNCCVHCPRNQNKTARGNHQRSKRKGREKGQVMRETREVNILYVTNQILTMKKEIVDRSYEEWI